MASLAFGGGPSRNQSDVKSGASCSQTRHVTSPIFSTQYTPLSHRQRRPDDIPGFHNGHQSCTSSTSSNPVLAHFKPHVKLPKLSRRCRPVEPGITRTCGVHLPYRPLIPAGFGVRARMGLSFVNIEIILCVSTKNLALTACLLASIVFAACFSRTA
ncbi:hypothetical protein BDU57DRAFT_224537 [Ampelomyces quisqualis]|uniref:Uncharacterized protein n=1 Tax=Ampelomyces quisqualis TaxID=50730 RepID=A0A6A5QKJ4_AMPQU|nr:hypothetical protein BDU57DRAFT_224537 [Ampelomyces quisqualis]